MTQRKRQAASQRWRRAARVASNAVAATLFLGAVVAGAQAGAQAGVPAETLLMRVPHGAVAVEQTVQGRRPAARIVASFDGLGVGFGGTEPPTPARNPSDNSLAVGPDHIVQVVNAHLAIFTKRGRLFDTTGKVLRGAEPTNSIFKGFGGLCEERNNGDAVVRYDQLAARWLFVMPVFSRGRATTKGPNADSPVTQSADSAFAMCYAVSVGGDPAGPYYRYEFVRQLFPDYPRPAVWPDGYYVATSTGDDVIQKHACVADRERMLRGEPATEQCVIIDGVNFLNNADIDGRQLPPPGAPNIMMAAGGAQLKQEVVDDRILVWTYHVDWRDSSKSRLTGPVRIAVAPYRYLCEGQLTRCVSQPGTGTRLDAQGDKLMARLVYRRIGNREMIVAVHSVNTSAGGGGVRWYEFRVANGRRVKLRQQGTYAPGGYRWMGSPAIDAKGNIGIGYSYGGAPDFAGQRFAARGAGDPPGILTLHESVLVEGEAAQTGTIRWEDYTQTAIDPSDDCTVWYVGDYLRKGSASYSTRIGAFRMPGCGPPAR